MKRILLIEGCNFIDYPIGGYLSFAKQMISAFGNQLLLVGVTDDETPVGRWVKKDIDGIEFEFFSIRKIRKTQKKPLIPERLKIYFAVRRYQKSILKCNVKNVFIQTPEVLFSINKKGLNICARIPGVENPLTYSRYSFSKYFAGLFDYFFFKSLKSVNIILATANKSAIKNFLERGNSISIQNKVLQFPTRINTNIFKPEDINLSKKRLGFDLSTKIITTTGRLNTYKGWEFMLNSFIEFRKNNPNSFFVFLGDGEDRLKVIDFIKNNNIEDSVVITGRLNHEKLSQYLNASDVYVMGSFVEGWATSLVEAIACAKPVVCTNFSSAEELVEINTNGFIDHKRDFISFSKMIDKCFFLSKDKLIKKSIEMQKYATNNLKDSILESWKLNESLIEK